MNTKTEIKNYLDSLPEAKRKDLQDLQERILKMFPKSKLWFLDGKDEKGKVVSNPNIGFGKRNIKYKDGSSKEFYQVGLSANTSGISVYILGFDDKSYLSNTYGNKIGKASLTGYCIKFKRLKDIHLEILEAAVRDGFAL